MVTIPHSERERIRRPTKIGPCVSVRVLPPLIIVGASMSSRRRNYNSSGAQELLRRSFGFVSAVRSRSECSTEMLFFFFKSLSIAGPVHRTKIFSTYAH